MSKKLPPELQARVDEHYVSIRDAIIDADGLAEFNVVTHALASHLAAALVCIDMLQDRVGAIEHLLTEAEANTRGWET